MEEILQIGLVFTEHYYVVKQLFYISVEFKNNIIKIRWATQH